MDVIINSSYYIIYFKLILYHLFYIHIHLVFIVLSTFIADIKAETFNLALNSTEYTQVNSYFTSSRSQCAMQCLNTRECAGYSYEDGLCAEFRPNCSGQHNGSTLYTSAAKSVQTIPYC